MDFIIDEAEISDGSYSELSDREDELSSADDFIESDNDNIGNDETFYRRFDNTFKNQMKNPVDVYVRSEGDYYGEEDQHEMFFPEKRDQVEYHCFENYKERAADFKKTLLRFSDESIENHFFYSVVYGLMYFKTAERPLKFESIIDVLGRENFLKVKEIESETMLDYTHFGFFGQCTKMNHFLAVNFGYFLRFFERRNKFRNQLRQKLKAKNEMRAELFSCVIQKFNGYDLLKTQLSRDEKKNLLPLDIVYELTLDLNKPILCYFSPEIHLAFNTCYDKIVKGSKKSVKSNKTKQCPYCNNFFVKAEKRMNEHVLCCTGHAGFNFKFDNCKIINYQENFKKMGHLPFAVYYDFETTTESAVFFDAKMYVISYCIIAAFHPDLNLPRIFIYRAYDQNKTDLTSLFHFEVVQPDFFNFKETYNLKTLKQLESAALAVENRSRKTALAEMFNIELKFTVDCLRFWFNRNKKVND